MSDHSRGLVRLGDVTIEVMVRYKGTWNAGHVCGGCSIAAQFQN